VGALTSLTVWSNQDFGIAAALVVAVFMFFIPLHTLTKRSSVYLLFIAGAGLGFLMIHLLYLSHGQSINYEFFGFFARQFGLGFGSESIHTPGPVLIVLPLILALAISHLYLLRRARGSIDATNFRLLSNSVIGVLFSAWAALGFVYFLNRSFASGQLQVLLLPVAISLGALIGSVLLLRKSENRPILDLSFRNLTRKGNKHLYVLSLVAALPLASLVLLPNPLIEVQRISEGIQEPRWPKASITQSLADSEAGIDFTQKEKSSIAFFGASANYVTMQTGIPSAIIFNNPNDLMISEEAMSVGCEFLLKNPPDYLILSQEGAALFTRLDSNLCNAYELFDIPGVQAGHSAKHISLKE
jgi:hypothetical protein